MGSEASINIPLDDLPDEILVVVLSFCPENFLIHKASLVCKKWRDISRGQMLWRLRCDRKGVTIPDALPPEYRDYRKLCLKNVFGKNLLKNWDAAGGIDHWRHTAIYITENDALVLKDDPGIVIEDSTPEESCGSDPLSELNVGTSKCWAFTEWIETLAQEIDLIKEGLTPEILDDLQPPISISVWTAARFDCASQYTISVSLAGERNEALKKANKFEDLREVPQWGDNSWVKISHTFRDYGKGVRQLTFVNTGKDKQGWAGNYGPKVAAPCVKIIL